MCSTHVGQNCMRCCTDPFPSFHSFIFEIHPCMTTRCIQLIRGSFDNQFLYLKCFVGLSEWSPVSAADVIHALQDYYIGAADPSRVIPNLPFGVPMNNNTTMEMFYAILTTSDIHRNIQHALAHRMFQFDQTDLWWLVQSKPPTGYENCHAVLHNIQKRVREQAFRLRIGRDLWKVETVERCCTTMGFNTRSLPISIPTSMPMPADLPSRPLGWQSECCWMQWMWRAIGGSGHFHRGWRCMWQSFWCVSVSQMISLFIFLNSVPNRILTLSLTLDVCDKTTSFDTWPFCLGCLSF